LVPDHAITPDFLGLTGRIRDHPMARQQLNDGLAVILHFDPIGPDVVVVRRFRLIFEIEALDPDRNPLGGFLKLRHGFPSTVVPVRSDPFARSVNR